MSALELDGLFARGLLRPAPRCPVCGGGDRLREHVRSAPDPYCLAMARVLGIDEARLEEVLASHRCLGCRSLWSDPWLTSRALSCVYAVMRHASGWERFEAWRGRPPGEGAEKSRRLHDLLVTAGGPIARYAELNCPFWGLLPYFRDAELGADKPQRITAALARLGDEDAAPAVVAEPTAGRPPPVAPVRALVFESSSGFWCHGCTAGGHGCRSVAAAALDAVVLDWKDVARERLRFDVFAIFNVLDHFDDPLPVVQRAVAASRLVYVDGHGERGGAPFRRQHPFVLGAQALERVSAGRWSVLDVGALVGGKSRQAHLLSAEIDLAGRIERLVPQDLGTGGGAPEERRSPGGLG